MATIKKIKTNKPTTKVEPKKKFGWIDFNDNVTELNEDHFEDTEGSIDIDYYTPDGKKYSIGGKVDELPNCCGVSEIGGISISKNFPQKQFNEFMKAFTSYHKGHTLIINTNNKGHSVTFETLLAKCPHFVDVKRFTNSGSGSRITMWVSNND